MMRLSPLRAFAGVCVFMVASLAAFCQSVTVTANLRSLTGADVTSGAYFQFTLKAFNGNPVRVVGSAWINTAPIIARPDSSGHISVALEGNDTLTSYVVNDTYYLVEVYSAGAKIYGAPFKITGSPSFDLDAATPISLTPPNSSLPTGSLNYVDTFSNQTIGGNKDFSGTIGVGTEGSLIQGASSGGGTATLPDGSGTLCYISTCPGSSFDPTANIAFSGVDSFSAPVTTTTLNGILNPLAFPGSPDFGLQHNNAAASCIAGQPCYITIPPVSQLTITTPIVFVPNENLQCIRDGAISNSPVIDNAPTNLYYNGSGAAITMGSYGGRLIGCDISLGSSVAAGVFIGNGSSTGVYSNHVEDSSLRGGGAGTYLVHVSCYPSGSCEDNNIINSRFSSFLGVAIGVDTSNDTHLINNTAYGLAAGNTTSISLLVDSGGNGLVLSNFIGGSSGLHGMVVRNTLAGGSAPLWGFLEDFETDESSSDGILFDGSLSSAPIGYTCINCWAAGSGGANVHISGGSGITFNGGVVRAGLEDGVLIDAPGAAAPGNITIEGNLVEGNNQSSGTYSGITITGHPSNVGIVNNQINNYPWGGYQQYALKTNSDVEGLRFTDNDCSNNVVGCSNTSSVTSTKLTYFGNINVVTGVSNETNYFPGPMNVPSLTVSGLTSGRCVQTTTGGGFTVASGACGTSSGTLTATGSPASGNLAAFSAGTSLTNVNLSGDASTSGSAVVEVTGLLNKALPSLATGCLNYTSGGAWALSTCGSGGLPAVMIYEPAGTSLATLQAAINGASPGTEFELSGTYSGICGLTNTHAGIRLRGLNEYSTTFTCATAGTPVMTVSGSGGNGFEMTGVTMQHITNTPTCIGGPGTSTCGDGLQILGGSSRVKLQNNHFNFNYDNLVLGYTSYGDVVNSEFEYAQGDNIYFLMDPTHTTMQWSIRGGLAEQALGNGVNMTCPSAFSGVQSTGPNIYDFTSYANGLSGFRYSCSAATSSGIADVILDGVTSTTNNGSDILLDLGPAGGRNSTVRCVLCELAGQANVGAGFARSTQTPTGVGDGVTVTSSCDATTPPSISGVFWENSDAGVNTSCAGTKVSEGDYFHNGLASGATATQSDVEVQASNVSITDNYFRNTTNGLYIVSGDTPNDIGNVCDSSVTNCKAWATFPPSGFQSWIGPSKVTVGSGPAGLSIPGIITGTQYATTANCAVNSTSPAACGSAASGAVVIPTTTTTYTIDTSAVTAHSRIQLTWLSFASDLPSSPTCVAPSASAEPTVSAVSAGTSFTISLASTSGQTCPMFTITN